MRPLADTTNTNVAPCGRSTPSPSDRGRIHSPWTAARCKKKSREEAQHGNKPAGSDNPPSWHEGELIALQLGAVRLQTPGSTPGSSAHSSPAVDRSEGEVHPAKAYIVDHQAQQVQEAPHSIFSLQGVGEAGGDAGSGQGGRGAVWFGSQDLQAEAASNAAAGIPHSASWPAGMEQQQQQDQQQQQQDGDAPMAAGATWPAAGEGAAAPAPPRQQQQQRQAAPLVGLQRCESLTLPAGASGAQAPVGRRTVMARRNSWAGGEGGPASGSALPGRLAVVSHADHRQALGEAAAQSGAAAGRGSRQVPQPASGGQQTRVPLELALDAEEDAGLFAIHRGGLAPDDAGGLLSPREGPAAGSTMAASGDGAVHAQGAGGRSPDGASPGGGASCGGRSGSRMEVDGESAASQGRDRDPQGYPLGALRSTADSVAGGVGSASMGSGRSPARSGGAPSSGAAAESGAGVPGAAAYERQLRRAARDPAVDQVKAAQQVWDAMQGADVAPQLVTLNALLQCWRVGGGSPEDAEAVACSMCLAGGFQPDATSSRLMQAIDMGWQQLGNY